MIAGLYKIFDHWHKEGTLWIYSDPHFDDKDLKAAVPGRPDAETQLKSINSCVGKKDVIIFLGDIGNLEYAKRVKGYKILIMGNHDAGRTNYERKIIREKYDISAYSLDDVKKIAQYKHYGWKATIFEGYDISRAPFHYWELIVDNQLFDEVYEGPVMIGEKLILSHEPVNIPWAFNIHGHVHDARHKNDTHHLNVCSDVIGYTPVNMNQLMKSGILSKVETIHRTTIDTATERKQKRIQKKNKRGDK
jgi:calcineurin-like phosphoesterase family protein